MEKNEVLLICNPVKRRIIFRYKMELGLQMKNLLVFTSIIYIILHTATSLQAQELVKFTLTHISKTEKKIEGPMSEMALKSLLEFVKDCSTSKKEEHLKPITYKGFEIKFIKPITLEIPENHSNSLKEVAFISISTNEKSIQNFNISIQVQLINGDIYSLGKYAKLAYATICMIENPI